MATKAFISDLDLVNLFSEQWSNPVFQYTTIVILLISTLSFYQPKKKQRYAPHVPIVGIPPGKDIVAARERFRTDAKNMIQEGYMKVSNSDVLITNANSKQYKGKPFYVPRPLGEQLIIPATYVEELKTAPIKEVDFVGTFLEVIPKISLHQNNY
jgi:hypothetical protein